MCEDIRLLISKHSNCGVRSSVKATTLWKSGDWLCRRLGLVYLGLTFREEIEMPTKRRVPGGGDEERVGAAGRKRKVRFQTREDSEGRLKYSAQTKLFEGDTNYCNPLSSYT